MRFFQKILNIGLGNGGVGFLLYGLLLFWVIVIGMDIVCECSPTSSCTDVSASRDDKFNGYFLPQNL